MNTEIILDEEQVTEEVYRGVYVIDNRLTPRQQRRKIFNMMKQAGIKVENESEYSIEYEGVEDDNGIGETQTTKFIVKRKYLKKTPYRITKEEVYHGTYILDGLKLTPEEQRNKIFNLMKEDGYVIDDNADYEIGYEGVEDDKGISETQSTKFTVYKVTKEKLDEKEVAILESEESSKIKDLYQEMLDLREQVQSAKNNEEVEEIANKVNNLTEKVDDVVEKAIKDYGSFEKDIEKLNEEIKELEEKLKNNIVAYEESFNRIKALMEEEKSASLEQKEALAKKKEKENDKSLSIRKEIEKQKRELASLKGKRTKLKHDLETARMLELSSKEYNDLVSNLRKKGILEAILVKKGLEDILAIPSRDRTANQKKLLKEAKEEIMREIASLQKEDNKKSILENIEALYGLESQTLKTDCRERVLIVRNNTFNKIVTNARNLPEKIIKTKQQNVDYEPGKAPEDLKGVFETKDTKKESKGLIDKFVIYRDLNNQDKLYLRKPTFERFAIDPIGEEVRIDGTACFEVSLQDANNIRANYNNDYSPYVVEERYGKVFRNIKSNGLTDKFTIFRDVNNQDKLYARKPVFERFNIEPVGEELRIDGTACFEIKTQDANNIRANANNDYSPYKVEEKLAKVSKQTNVNTESNGLTDKFTIFRDLNNQDKLYVRKPVFERFNIEPISEEVRINGTACFEVKTQDANDIRVNKNNDYSPYVVEEKLAKVLVPDKAKINPESKGLMDKFTIFRDENNQDKLYVRKPVFERFAIKPIGEEVRIDGVVCYEISLQDANNIRANYNNYYSPYIVVEKTGKVVQKAKDTKEVITSITTDLVDPKKYTPSNLQITKAFRNELKEGNTSYNVVHSGQNAKTSIALLDMLCKEILETEKAKKIMQEVENRLNNLSDDELKLLFKEYKTNKLDIPHRLNPLVLSKISEVGVTLLKESDNKIKDNYSALYELLGNLKIIEEKQSSSLSKEDLKQNEESRNKLLEEAFKYVEEILKNREEAEEIITSIDDLKPYYLEAIKNLKYVGMKYNTDNNSKADNYNNNLNNALKNKNYESILQNFMGLESCYYDNEKVKGKIVGKGSIGKEYYDIVANQFKYNKVLDDMMDEYEIDEEEQHTKTR